MKFYGEYTHQVDDNGRIRIPSSFKEKLGSTCKIMLGVNKSLVVMDNEYFNNMFAKKFADIDPTDTNKLRALRLWSSNCAEIEYDKQGRVLLPMQLKKKVGIEKDIVIAGVGNWIEIWDATNWSNYNNIGNLDTVFEEFNAVK